MPPLTSTRTQNECTASHTTTHCSEVLHSAPMPPRTREESGCGRETGPGHQLKWGTETDSRKRCVSDTPQNSIRREDIRSASAPAFEAMPRAFHHMSRSPGGPVTTRLCSSPLSPSSSADTAHNLSVSQRMSPPRWGSKEGVRHFPDSPPNVGAGGVRDELQCMWPSASTIPVFLRSYGSAVITDTGGGSTHTSEGTGVEDKSSDFPDSPHSVVTGMRGKRSLQRLGQGGASPRLSITTASVPQAVGGSESVHERDEK